MAFTPLRAQSTLDAHRGPFQLLVMRPGKKAGFYKTEWLVGSSDKTDVLDEAIALLRDVRDTIYSVAIVSIPEQASAFVVRGRDLEAL